MICALELYKYFGTQDPLRFGSRMHKAEHVLPRIRPCWTRRGRPRADAADSPKLSRHVRVLWHRLDPCGYRMLLGTADNAEMEASLCNTCSAPRVPPDPTWKCAHCTCENRNMLANVCEVCQEARNKAVAARMRVIARAWDAK